MPRKEKLTLQREHFTDEEWEAFRNAMQIMVKLKRKVLTRRAAAGGKV